MHSMDPFGNIPVHTNDFELHDFIADPNFYQFINLIRGENEDAITNFDCYNLNSCFVDNQFGPTPVETYDFNPEVVADPNYVVNTLPSFDGDMNGGLGDDDGEDSSATTTTMTTTTPTTRKTKVDRSRTLISERRRRGRMKEKLYALRSLVPNITKMDKASIIGDAVLYVQELQMKAKKLKSEIAGLEASLVKSEGYREPIHNPKKNQVTSSNNPICKTIMQMDVFQVEERGFYLRLVCNKGEGVAVSLYKALESLTSFNVQNSNLATLSEKFVLTFTLYVGEHGLIMNLPNLKLWVTGALMNQGFEFITPLSA